MNDKCSRCREVRRPSAHFCTRCGLAHDPQKARRVLARPIDWIGVAVAWALVLHVITIVLVVALSMRPYIRAVREGEMLRAIGSGACWFVTSVVICMTIAVWHGDYLPRPRLANLWPFGRR